MAIKISGTTVIDDSKDINNIGIVTISDALKVGTAITAHAGILTVTDTLKVGTDITAHAGILTVTDTLKVGTAITARAGIITADIIHLTGGTFGPIDGGSDTRADTAMVVGENFHIYNVESSGGHLRNLIEKSNNVISIGEEDTATINKIRLIPGSSNGVTELWAGDPSQSYNSIGILTANAAGVIVSGILSATTFKGPSGVTASFIGDGGGLTGITGSGSGVIINHDDSLVGTAGTINFSTNLDVTAVSAGVCTITASGGGVNVVIAAMVFG